MEYPQLNVIGLNWIVFPSRRRISSRGRLCTLSCSLFALGIILSVFVLSTNRDLCVRLYTGAFQLESYLSALRMVDQTSDVSRAACREGCRNTCTDHIFGIISLFPIAYIPRFLSHDDTLPFLSFSLPVSVITHV